MADELVLRTLHFYNTGEGLTRAEVVDMAKTIERQRTAMLKAATAIAVLETGKTEPTGAFRGSSIFDMLRAAAAHTTESVPPGWTRAPRYYGPDRHADWCHIKHENGPCLDWLLVKMLEEWRSDA